MDEPPASVAADVIAYGFWMRKEGYSETTIERYVRLLRELAKYGDLRNPESLKAGLTRTGWADGAKEMACGAYAIYAMQFEPKDRLRIVQTLPTETVVTRQIRGTIRTRSRKAAQLQFGRWYYESLERKLPDLVETFHADDKRVRETYDSYGLARERRWIGSRALTVAEFHEKKIGQEAETMTAPTSKAENRYTVDFVKRWLREHAKSAQTVVWNR